MATTRCRRLGGFSAAAVLGLAGVGFGAVPAYAASGNIYKGPSGSFGHYEQNDSSNQLRIFAAPTNLGTNQCLDLWYDWTRISGEGTHYDARMARSCRDYTTRDSGTNTETYNVFSWNKLGACYGPNNATTSPISNCTDSELSTVLPSVPNTCTRSWVVQVSGTLQYGSGGSSVSCSS